MRRAYSPPAPCEETRAIVGELRAELAYGVNFTRAIEGAAPADRATLRRLAQSARDLRTRPDVDETAAAFGRRGKL